MPNDCWNHMTITCEDPEELTRLVQNELQEKGELCKWVFHDTIEMIKRGAKGIMFRQWTPWNPNYDWLENLLTKYPLCWIKNEWDEEGGMAGVWVGYTNKNDEQIVQKMMWRDLCIEEKHFLFLEEPEC
jgi:hypothetical protein